MKGITVYDLVSAYAAKIIAEYFIGCLPLYEMIPCQFTHLVQFHFNPPPKSEC